MKELILIGFLFLGIPCFATAPSIREVRSLYQQAVKEEKECKELIKLLAPYNENNDPLLLGYKAGATMLMAKYIMNPFSKLSYFKKGKKLLQKAIDADNENIELRFLRFGIQTNAPAFLDYKDAIGDDKLFLIKSIPRLHDQQLKQLIVSYLSSSDYVTLKEKQQLIK